MDQLSRAILEQPPPSFSSEDLTSYFEDLSNRHVLVRSMARIVNRIAIACADIGLESAQVRSLDWEPTREPPSQLLAYRKSKGNLSFQSTMDSLFLKAFPIWTNRFFLLIDEEIKAAVIGIRLARSLARGQERAGTWSCIPSEDTDECSENHQLLKISCKLDLRDEADRVLFRTHTSPTQSEGQVCHRSTFFLDIKRVDDRLRLKLESPETDTALRITFRYKPLNWKT